MSQEKKERKKTFFFSNAMPLRSDPLYGGESLPQIRTFSEEKNSWDQKQDIMPRNSL
jgi:hypothetical protein